MTVLVKISQLRFIKIPTGWNVGDTLTLLLSLCYGIITVIGALLLLLMLLLLLLLYTIYYFCLLYDYY